MNKKIFIIAILCLVFGIMLTQRNYAKYTMDGSLAMYVYIDKTPPIINITTNGEIEKFEKTQTDIVKRTEDVTIDTSDNIKIKNNEYSYNPSDSNFDNLESNPFENGEKLTEEGYYKIKTEDTSGNVTEIIILLDKSAPVVNVQYFKKGEERSLLKNNEPMRQVSAIRKCLASQEVIALNNTIENDTIENITEENITDEEIIENSIDDSTENIEEIEVSEEIFKQTSKEDTEQITEETQEFIDNNVNNEQAEDVEPIVQSNVMLMSARAGEIYVGNEQEFRNGLAMQASVIRIRDSIDFGSPVVVNYPLTVVRESDSNALRYGNRWKFYCSSSRRKFSIRWSCS